MKSRQAKYTIGQVVKHRIYPFRGVIFDVVSFSFKVGFKVSIEPLRNKKIMIDHVLL